MCQFVAREKERATVSLKDRATNRMNLNYNQRMHGWWLLAVVCVGCGDPLASGDYEGEPLLRLAGTISGEISAEEPATPQLTIAWVDLVGDETTTGLIGTEIAPVSSTRFPAQFSFDVFEPPPSSAIFDSPQGDGRMAVGLLMIIDSASEEDVVFLGSAEGWGPIAPVRLLGVSWFNQLLYIEVPPALGGAVSQGLRISNPELLQPGYRVLRTACTAGEGQRTVVADDEVLDEEISITMFLGGLLVREDAEKHCADELVLPSE